MNGSSQGQGRPDMGRGPAIYWGYCSRTRRYRMMDASDYVSSMQEGVSKLMNDTTSAYQDMMRGYSQQWARGGGMGMPWESKGHEHGEHCEHCGDRGECHDCHCDCCIGDADVVVHARAGELRRISITLENDTRRER